MRLPAWRKRRERSVSSRAPLQRRNGGCFAVKEAVVKCFGTGFRGIEPAEIEVLRDALGKPYVRLSGAAAAYCAALGGLTPLVSISDTKTHAMAVAVLEREDRGGIK